MILLASLALLAAGAGCRREAPTPPPPRFLVEAGAPRELAELGSQPSAAAIGAGELVAIGGARGAVWLFGGAGAPLTLGETAIHDGPVRMLAFSRDGRALASAGGRVVAWWSTARRSLERQVHGPQLITAATLIEGDAPRVYFGTDHGALVRWDPRKPVAEPQPQLACPSEMRPAGRCSYGRPVVDSLGRAVCVYPVTAMAASGGVLAWACREGGLRTLELASGRSDGFSPGWLRLAAPLADGKLLAARGEGELRVYELRAKRLLRELVPAGAAEAAAAAGELIAIAQRGAIRIWAGEHPQAATTIATPERVAWIGLRTRGAATELLVLEARGRLLARPLAVRRAQ